MYIDLIADPYSDGKCVAVSDGNHKKQESTMSYGAPENLMLS